MTCGALAAFWKVEMFLSRCGADAPGKNERVASIMSAHTVRLHLKYWTWARKRRDMWAAPYTTGNTSNMQAHLRRHHLNIDISSTRKKPQKQETFPTDFRMKLQANSNRAQTINVTKSICVFMALDMRPFSVVENDGFTHLLSVLEPRYQLPSRPHFSQNVLPHLYSEVRAKLVKDLSNAKFIALTTDGWTSRVTLSFMTITAQYITDNWLNKYPVS